MILIHFPDTELKRRALGALAGRFPFKSWATGQMLVPESALPFLAVEGIAMYAAFAYVEVYFTRWAFRSSMSAAA